MSVSQANIKNRYAYRLVLGHGTGLVGHTLTKLVGPSTEVVRKALNIYLQYKMHTLIRAKLENDESGLN